MLNILPTHLIREASRCTHTTTHKGICEIVSVLTMKAYKGRRSIMPFILNLSTRWMWVVKFTQRPVYHGERTLISIDYEVWWTSETVWMIWRREQLLLLPEVETRIVQTIVVTATTLIPTTTLHRLLTLQRIAQFATLLTGHILKSNSVHVFARCQWC
jgi:hypothetical protein